MKRIILSILLLGSFLFLTSCNKETTESDNPDLPADSTNSEINNNLFPDGGFENLLFQNIWCSYGLGEYWITDSLAHTGVKSFYVQTTSTSDFEHCSMNIESGVDYELSLWYKLEGNISAFDNLILGFKQNGNYPYYVDLDTGWVSPISYDWTKFTDTIQFINDSPVDFYLHSNVQFNFFDDFVLRKI